MKMRQSVLSAILLLIAIPGYAYRTAAWIPPWEPSALTSTQLHAGSLDESNPVWYSLASSGAIVANWNAENPTWIAAMTGTRIIPTLQNVVNGSYDGGLAATLIGTDASRQSHSQAIVDLVVNKGWDGIDIDYERVPTTSRANFTAFINLLAQKLHTAGKQLSVTVYAKTSDEQNWNGPGAQDWAALGMSADWIKIMAYDYHWSTSEAGTITPLAWLDQVATYAESVIPAGKIMVGLPWYGYDWQGTNGKGIVYQEAISLANTKGATISHDADGEATFTYADHTVYFQDASSYKRKTDLLKQNHPNIAGVVHWRSGDEDPGFWTIMDALRGGVAPPPPPPGDFSVAGADTLTVRLSKSTNSPYSVTRLNGFSDAILVSAEKIDSFAGTLSVTPASLSGTETTSTLQVSTTRATALGTYRVKVRFTSGSLLREKIISVSVVRR